MSETEATPVTENAPVEEKAKGRQAKDWSTPEAQAEAQAALEKLSAEFEAVKAQKAELKAGEHAVPADLETEARELRRKIRQMKQVLGIPYGKAAKAEEPAAEGDPVPAPEE